MMVIRRDRLLAFLGLGEYYDGMAMCVCFFFVFSFFWVAQLQILRLHPRTSSSFLVLAERSEQISTVRLNPKPFRERAELSVC
jgi:hypothetical protein